MTDSEAPAWLMRLLHPWVCPDCNAPGATDCDSTSLAAEEVWTDLQMRINAAGEDGYYNTSDVIWWLGRNDALTDMND